MAGLSYTTTLLVHRTPDEVYDAINDVRAWWGERVEGRTDKTDAEWSFQDEYMYCRFQVTELIPGKRVVWRVLDSYVTCFEDKTELKGTEVRFELLPSNGATELRFTHAGLTPSTSGLMSGGTCGASSSLVAFQA